MKKSLSISIAILALAALAVSCSPAATSFGENPLKTLNVSGRGTVNLKPDLARVNLGVRSQSPDVVDALAENTESVQAIFQQLTDLGVDQQDIQTSNFNIYPQRDHQPISDEMPVNTFVVENTMAVTVRNLDSLGEILSAVVKEGANTIFGVTLDIEDREAAVEEARSLALANAKTQASAIAEAAGVQLSAIHSINFASHGGIPQPRMAFAVEEVMEAGDVTISSGQLTIEATVNLTYQIH